MIDLDNLNTLNDFYGHETGDRVLKQFAVILKKNLRRSDYVARFSGDEFIVLLPETDVIKARTVAEKVRRKTKKIRLFGLDKKQAVTASIGIAVYPSSSTIPSALVKAADLAMCHGKQHGKDQVCVYSPGLLTTISFDSRKIKRFAKNADLSTIQTLVTAVDLKDNYTQQHSAEVSRLSVCLAQALGLPEEDLEKLRIAGLLHDIGKIGIPDNILLKPGPLTKAEYSAVKKHPEYGVDILKHSSDFKDTLPIVLHHHEWFNGGGYPHALKKKKIPYLARIIAVTDAYQAMISDRPYREGLTIKEALAELKRCSGDQFDPEMVKTFTSILSKLDTGIAPSNLA